MLAAVAIFIINIYPDKDAGKININEEKNNQMPQVTLEQVKSKMESDATDYIILDVQTLDAFNEKHIAGSINIPLGEIGTRKDELPQDKEIIVTSGADNCGLSENAAEILIAYGFPSVKDFPNGVQKWQEAGLPLVGGTNVIFSYIGPDEVYKKIETGEDIMLVDIRELADYQKGHLLGAKHYAFEKLAVEAEKELPKNIEIIIYDKTGNRSKLLTEQLARQGYTEIKSLIGGTNEWEQRNYPLVNE